MPNRKFWSRPKIAMITKGVASRSQGVCGPARVLERAATGAVTAAVPISNHAQDHDHDQQVVSSDPALRKRLRIHGLHEGNSAFSRTEQG
jgi:hypothetical protein